MEDKVVQFNIDGQDVQVAAGTTVLEAARQIGVNIPTLCYLKDVNQPSGCRMCLVEVGGKLLASCSLEAQANMQVQTNSSKVRDARRAVIELLLSNHQEECNYCSRGGNCELQTLASNMHVRERRFGVERSRSVVDNESWSIVRDSAKCIQCGRCVSTCNDIQTVGAITMYNRGFETVVGPVYGRSLADSVCINCGQCVMACPVGALRERESIDEVWGAIADPTQVVVVQTAPAVRVALGEEFGLPIGTRVTGKMAAALRRLGFDKVFDTDFGADLTIMEEGTELLHRLQNGEHLPLMTSCCPGWVKFVEHNFPDKLDNLSTCKSPHEMEGALIKTYIAKKMDVDPSRITVVSVMPCVGKKFEQRRPELSYEELSDVDHVLTTRELARMIKEAGIDFVNLQDEPFDNPFGTSTGAGVIFGATGGVAEAALRTVFELVAGKELETIEYTSVRGTQGIKEAAVELPNGQVIRTAVVNGLGNARKVMQMMEKGERSYEFIEVMACPGGCVTGGGQPIIDARTRELIDVKALRAKAVYDEDRDLPVRKSHKNPDIQLLYKEFLGEPNSHLAHELLHTHYAARSLFK